MSTLETIRNTFAKSISTREDFEYGISEVAQMINGAAPNAANFQLIFDLLYWDWTAKHPPIDPKDLDRITLKYSSFGESQEAEINSQVKAAKEFAGALANNEITPGQALNLSMLELEMVVDRNSYFSASAKSKSHLTIPMEICRLLRNFYRAKDKYNPSATNVLRPLYLAKEVVQKSGQANGEELKQQIVGRISAFMRQIRANTAKGRWVIGDQMLELGAIDEFSEFIVFHLLGEKWNGDKSMFSSHRGIGLIEDAVFYLYLLEQEKENNQ